MIESTEQASLEPYLGFTQCPGIGPIRIKQLIETFGSVAKAWSADEKNLNKLLGPQLAKTVSEFRKNWNLSSVLLRAREKGVLPIIYEDKRYPEKLKVTDSAPFLLYVKYQGQTSLEKIFAHHSVAIVGSRKITSYGRQVTEKVVSELVAAGVVIVSGLMYGVDEVSHRAAIAAGGLTIGVWAGGIDTLWGTNREPLAKAVLGSGGILLSEFPLGLTPTAGLFPARNRIVSGLSDAVVVVEAAIDSGSLITAGHAAAQGREVFAVPGPVTSPQSLGTAKLIQKGAMLVTGAGEILEYLGLSSGPLKSTEISPSGLSPEENLVLDTLRNEKRHVDELIRLTGWETGKLTSVLSLMELKGLVRHLGGMVYGLA